MLIQIIQGSLKIRGGGGGWGCGVNGLIINAKLLLTAMHLEMESE